MTEEFESNEVMFYNAMRRAKETLRLCSGDNVVMTGGQIGGKAGSTNTIKLECIK
jgi:pyruvate kinase